MGGSLCGTPIRWTINRAVHHPVVNVTKIAVADHLHNGAHVTDGQVIGVGDAFTDAGDKLNIGGHFMFSFCALSHLRLAKMLAISSP